MMYSRLLKKNGLANYIGGSDYNFRAATAGEKISDDVEKLMQKANIQPQEIYTGEQKHLTNVAYCDGQNGSPYAFGRQFQETDGLITDQNNLALMIKFADCTPIVLFDPTKKVQASIHSGWRGTVGKIAQVTVKKMVEEFDVNKEDLLVYIGPSIDQQNYEVGPEVYAAFEDHQNRDKYFKTNGEKFLLDMSLSNYYLLLELGIPANNIEVATESTFLNQELHSARQEGTNYGLNAIVTAIIE